MKKDNDDAKKSMQRRIWSIKKLLPCVRSGWKITQTRRKKIGTTANALCVKDLEKLNEEELKLLPLKDFWDATKKEWKKNVFGANKKFWILDKK